METIGKDCASIIFNYLPLESARALGLTCSQFFPIYRKYLCAHPTLNHFKEILIKIREKEARELVEKENLEGFFMSKIYKKLDVNYYHIEQILKPDIRRDFGRGRRQIPPPTNVKTISKEEADLAYNAYLAALDSIITNTQQNHADYNELPLPTFVKYLIAIWIKYPSKYLRLVPYEILKQYLTTCETLGADFCVLFKTTQRCCSGPHVTDKEDIWNLGDKMVDLDEVLMAFSRTQTDSFLFGIFDLENRNDPPLTICHKCSQSKPCPAKCQHYYIDYENRFPDSGISKGKIEGLDNNPFTGYYEGTFLDVFNYFVKNRHLLR